MVSVPVRSAVAALAVTLTLTTPPPLPLDPLVIDIQPLSDAAVHVHWLAVFTVTEFDPPDAGKDNDDGDKEYVQGAGGGAVGELLPQAKAEATTRTVVNQRRGSFVPITSSRGDRSSATMPPARRAVVPRNLEHGEGFTARR